MGSHAYSSGFRELRFVHIARPTERFKDIVAEPIPWWPAPSLPSEVQYSTLSRAALESTKIIAESLTQFRNGPNAPALPDLKDRSVAS